MTRIVRAPPAAPIGADPTMPGRSARPRARP